MKTYISVFLFLAVCSASYGQASPSKSVKDNFNKLEWVLGKWERTGLRSGSSAYESWKKTSAYSFEGIGVSMTGSDTTFVEKLRIEIKDDKIYYVADVRQNAKPVYFELTEISAQGFVSKNMEHDFPKVISYSLKENRLTAIISDGGSKKMLFTFKQSQ